ncbi:MAG: cellulase family glycosylhydrolase [Polyangiaceae bacterium]
MPLLLVRSSAWSGGSVRPPRCALPLTCLVAILGLFSAACGDDTSTGGSGAGGEHAGGNGQGGSSNGGSPNGGAPNGGAANGGGGAANEGGAGGLETGGMGGTSTGGQGGGSAMPAGWLLTKPGDNKVYVSDGASESVWVGRGVNVDDMFLCGYNYGFWMSNPGGDQALGAVFDALVAEWHPTFLRLSLSMNSFSPVVGWTSDNAYKTAMTNIIKGLGAHPNTYVLVTLRSDTTMVEPNGGSCGQGDDAICLPSNATDDVYRALVTTFKDDAFVLFGIANEPGGLSSTDSDIRSRMDHAVSVIRAEEDQLGVPHHIVSVQGNQWTSKIGFYDNDPLPYDNVVYEYHSYPPTSAGYTMSNIPVIIGEYGPLNGDTSFASSFYNDVEAKSIPNLAWSLSPYSNCAPDLTQVTYDDSLTTTAWGQVVRTYLQSH